LDFKELNLIMEAYFELYPENKSEAVLEKETELKKKILITKDLDKKRKGIKFAPLGKWLLEN